MAGRAGAAPPPEPGRLVASTPQPLDKSCLQSSSNLNASLFLPFIYLG